MSFVHRNVASENAELADKLTLMLAELQQIAALPVDAPQGPPGRFYSDPDFFQHEWKTVLRQGWHCVGRADQYANLGDYQAIQLLDEPIIVVRSEDGIQAHANVCRHRGMPLASGSGTAKRFTCPYHAWLYGLDGKLQRAARMKNAGFDTENCKLGSFPCIERFGFVYVSLSENPPDFDDETTGLAELIGPYQPENYRVVHSATETWRANWKCLVENFMEGYHLSVVHPQTLHGYTPTGLSKKAASGPGFTSYNANYPQDIPSRGQGAPGLSDTQRHRSTLFSVFPCQVVSVAASLLVSLNIRPKTVDEIEVNWTMSVFGDEFDQATIAQRIELWNEVNREDREKLEIMQGALASVHAVGGPLAGEDYEGTVRDFLNWHAWNVAEA